MTARKRLTGGVPHCPGCVCAGRDLDTLSIYPPNAKLYGTCATCGTVRWDTEKYTGGRGEPRRTTHCDCCTHRHNLPAGGHDERCLANPANCVLIGDDER